MKRDISIYLKDIIENMEYAEKFIEGITIKDFVKDEKTYYAVIRCIEVMGEAVKHIPDSLRKQYPRIPWRDIAGMRDKAIHFYFGMNLERIWLVVKEDIPTLKPLIKKVFEEFSKQK